MTKFVFLLWLIFFSPLVSSANVSTTGAIPIIDDSYCAMMDRVLKSVIYPSDWCVFLLLEHLDCPLHTEENTMVTLSLKTLFNGFVEKAQDKFYCDKTLAVFETWKTFGDFIVGQKILKKFKPYNRLVLFSHKNSTDHGQLFRDYHLREIYLQAIHVYYTRIIGENSYELMDVLTNELIPFTSNNNLEKKIRSIRNFLIHPLFDTKTFKNEVNVSLYHCDPFVIRLDDLQTNNSR